MGGHFSVRKLSRYPNFMPFQELTDAPGEGTRTVRRMRSIMLDTIESLSLLTFVAIIGPILLGAALVYGIMMSRRRSKASKAQADSASRHLYREAAQLE